VCVSLRLSSNNYAECLNCLNLLRSRLTRNVGLLHEYEGTFPESTYEIGIIEAIPKAELCTEPNF